MGLSAPPPPPPTWATVEGKPTTIAGFGITDAFGVGQSWQDVTSSRSVNTTYTNSTGKPITVCFACGDTAGQVVNIRVDGLFVTRSGQYPGQGNGSHSATFIVPNGSIYRFEGSFPNGGIRELR